MHVWYIMYIVLLCVYVAYTCSSFSFIVTIVDSSEEILCSESMKSSHNVILRINVAPVCPANNQEEFVLYLNLKPCSV